MILRKNNNKNAFVIIRNHKRGKNLIHSKAGMRIRIQAFLICLLEWTVFVFK